MRRIFVFAVLYVFSSTALADEVAELSLPYAEQFIEHMREFDTDGVASLLYTEPMLRLGTNPSQLKAMAAQSDERMRNAGAHYSSFDLGVPTKSFSGPDGIYTLIPYSCVLELGGRKISQDAFFLAVSADDGKSWRFMDGIATARVPIETILPNYSGPPLPNVARRPVQ